MSTLSLDWNGYPPAEYTGGAVTVGNFDGVHLGHLALVEAARRRARPVVAVTFDPPPYQVLHPQSVPSRPPLTTIPQRAALLQKGGVDHVIILRTTPALLALSPEAFFEDVLVRQLGAKAVVEGYDFRFGRGRTGTNVLLAELCAAQGLAFEEIAPFRVGGQAVSSSLVRMSLEGGNVAFARELLGRSYSIAGQVGTGAKRGRTIGFPTANVEDLHTLLPAEGVYAVRASVSGRRYAGAANIGPNPTFGEHARKVEVHLLDFEGDIYGQSIEVSFVQRLRETRPFAGIPALVEQLQRDVAEARGILDTESA